jgi:hypothetical protein
LLAGCDEAYGTDWMIGADSTVVRAHRHAGRPQIPAAELVRGHRRMIRAYHTTTQTFPAGHDMMLDTAWEQTAMVIEAAIAERHARR